MFENAPLAGTYPDEKRPQMEYASDGGELVPPEVLEDIRLSHSLAWHIGELGIGVQRLDAGATDYIGPPYSTVIKFASSLDRMTFLDEVLGMFTPSGDETELDLFPVDRAENTWQLMIYGCDPEQNPSYLNSPSEMNSLNRETKKEFDAFLHNQIHAGWRPEYCSSLPPCLPKAQIMAEYLLTKIDKRYF
jgi:hypothetical protein